MTEKAASLVDQAKQWATYYGDFTKGDEGAVLSVPLRIRAAWDRNDADAFASVFVESGSMLVGDEQLKGRDAIRSYMADGFQGELKGAKLTEEPVKIKMIAKDVAVAITVGGVLKAGETTLPRDREVRATYVVVRQDGNWWLVSHQTSPIKG